MSTQSDEYIVLRYSLAVVLGAIVGAWDHIFEDALIGPAHGAIAGLATGLLIRSWFALLFPPPSMILGFVIVTIVSWEPVWIYPLGWIIALPLSVLTTPVGVLIGRRLESIQLRRSKIEERTDL